MSGSGSDLVSGRVNTAEETTTLEGGGPDDGGLTPFDGAFVLNVGPTVDDGTHESNSTINGLLARGGNGISAENEPGAGVVSQGSPQGGPGIVALGGGAAIADFEESPPPKGSFVDPSARPQPILNIPDGLLTVGEGGIGLIAVGGLSTAAFPPGVGVVGQGGLGSSPTTGGFGASGVVGIAGGRFQPKANLTSLDTTAAQNTGVIGCGSDAVGSPFLGGAGIKGIGGGASKGATFGAGVVGAAGDVTPPAPAAIGSVGLAGFGNTGVGGLFSSATIAQIRLVPSPIHQETPDGIPGSAGDLLVLLPDPREQIATLWFCRGNSVWIKIA